MFLTKSFDHAENQTLYQNKSCEIPSHFDWWSTKYESIIKLLNFIVPVHQWIKGYFK